MNYFLTVIVVIVFAYIVIRKRLAPFLRSKRNKGRGADTPDNSPAGNSISGMNGGISAGKSNANTRFEVLAFSVLESENSVSFRERVSLHLNKTAMELDDKGYVYDFDYMAVAEVLVVVFRYQI